MMKSLRTISLLTGFFLFLSLICVNTLQACTGIDLIITKITFTSLESDTYTYTYEIKNIGTESVPISEISLQNYVSTDAQGTNTKAAGGSKIDFNGSAGIIAAGASYTGTMGAYPNAVGNYPLHAYPYLIVDVFIYPGTECNNTNNRITGKIEVITTDNQKQHIADAAVNWNTDTKSFLVNHWSGRNASMLHYNVFSTSGIVLLSGNTAEGQTTSLSAIQSGTYIIYLSDGEKVYSKKIIY